VDCAKCELLKINNLIHTDTIKQNLIPIEVTAEQVSIIYVGFVDINNVAMFGMTAKMLRTPGRQRISMSVNGARG